MPKFQKPHRNKYKKRDWEKQREEESQHWSQQRRNYYGVKPTPKAKRR